MASTLVETSIMLYELVQMLVAFTAIVLAVKWKKYEFLIGLSFLGLYAIVEAVDAFLFTVMHVVFLDIAQFGFILLAIIFLIVGMHPSWSPRLAFGMKKQLSEPPASRPRSLISVLRKL